MEQCHERLLTKSSKRRAAKKFEIGSIWEAFRSHLGGIVYFGAILKPIWTVLKPHLIPPTPTLAPDPSPALAPDPDLPLSPPLPILSPYFAWDSKIPLPLPIPDFNKLFCPLSGHFPWQKKHVLS